MRWRSLFVLTIAVGLMSFVASYACSAVVAKSLISVVSIDTGARHLDKSMLTPGSWFGSVFLCWEAELPGVMEDLLKNKEDHDGLLVLFLSIATATLN